MGIQGRASESSLNVLKFCVELELWREESCVAFVIFSKGYVVPQKIKIWWFSQWPGEQNVRGGRGTSCGTMTHWLVCE